MSSRIATTAVIAFVLAVIALAAAGRTDLPRVWAYIGMVWVMLLTSTLMVPANTMEERFKRGQKTADPVALAFIRLFAAASLIGSFLDVGRLHLSDGVPLALSLAGLAAAAGAFLFILWAISVNRFFVPQVRIQSDRGHPWSIPAPTDSSGIPATWA